MVAAENRRHRDDDRGGPADTRRCRADPSSRDEPRRQRRPGDRRREGHGHHRVAAGGGSADTGWRPRAAAPRRPPVGTRYTGGESTGLGPAVVHGVVAEHGGRVTVESRLGAGTCFDVYLLVPTAQAESQKPDAAA